MGLIVFVTRTSLFRESSFDSLPNIGDLPKTVVLVIQADLEFGLQLDEKTSPMQSARENFNDSDIQTVLSGDKIPAILRVGSEPGQ